MAETESLVSLFHFLVMAYYWAVIGYWFILYDCSVSSQAKVDFFFIGFLSRILNSLLGWPGYFLWSKIQLTTLSIAKIDDNSVCDSINTMPFIEKTCAGTVPFLEIVFSKKVVWTAQ